MEIETVKHQTVGMKLGVFWQNDPATLHTVLI